MYSGCVCENMCMYAGCMCENTCIRAGCICKITRACMKILHLNKRVHIDMYICTFICIFVHTHVCMLPEIEDPSAYISEQARTYRHVYMYRHMHIRKHSRMYVAGKFRPCGGSFVHTYVAGNCRPPAAMGRPKLVGLCQGSCLNIHTDICTRVQTYVYSYMHIL